ncbi:hypothetical protein NIIDNTM18_30810 [Mycolicibacterium litorale]|uniref:Uncharacterized protein n=1 Tax=Mycolicibacterium litorale TaxID=758802 RepID=A0A6S6P1U0_9MYCO|nr:hypothetical protein [Mycolicibacterium litorale]BCI53803.1 hypothetical protein NIIDNTM18_30810 [Mycolicibacterium litorale]
MAAEVYTEIALAELGHLAAGAGGDPAMLDDALGTTGYFGREDVLAVGRRLNDARVGESDAPGHAETAAYFGAVGAVLAADPAVTVVTVGPQRSVIYFAAPGRHVEVAIVDGRAFLALRAGEVTVDTSAELTLAVRHRAGSPRRHLAVTGGAVAVSDDGNDWRSIDLDGRTPAEALRDFVTG